MRFLFLVRWVKGSWKKNAACVFYSLMKVGKKEGTELLFEWAVFCYLSWPCQAVFSWDCSNGRNTQHGCVGDHV